MWKEIQSEIGQIKNCNVVQFNGRHYYWLQRIEKDEHMPDLLPGFDVENIESHDANEYHELLFGLKPHHLACVGQYVLAPERVAKTVLINNPVKLFSYAETFLQSLNVTIPLIRVDKDDSPFTASYSLMEKHLEFYPREMYRHVSLNLVLENILPHDSITIIMSHELGHACDVEAHTEFEKYRDTIDEYYEGIRRLGLTGKGIRRVRQLAKGMQAWAVIQLGCEKRAWELGVQFVPEHLKDLYWNEAERSMRSRKDDTINQIDSLENSIENAWNAHMILGHTSNTRSWFVKHN